MEPHVVVQMSTINADRKLARRRGFLFGMLIACALNNFLYYLVAYLKP